MLVDIPWSPYSLSVHGPIFPFSDVMIPLIFALLAVNEPFSETSKLPLAAVIVPFSFKVIFPLVCLITPLSIIQPLFFPTNNVPVAKTS